MRVCTLGLLTLVVLALTSGCEHCDEDVPSRLVPRDWHSKSNADGGKICGAGIYYDRKNQVCKPCPEGTFLTKAMADSGLYFFCERCHQPDTTTHEIVAQPCNATNDAVIHCDTGLYRKVIPNPENCNCKYACTSCDICGVGTNMFLSYEKSVCTTFTNTLCCLHRDMLVVDGRCVNPPTTPTTTSTTTTKSTTTITEEDKVGNNKEPAEKQSRNTAATSTVSLYMFLTLLHCIAVTNLCTIII